jgi:uncharacterized phiE125 gp8 family phage protein
MSAFYYPITHTSPEVISLDTAKKQLKMEDLGTYDDALITECIEAAIDEAENYCNISIRERKYTVKFTDWQQDFEFRMQYVQSVDSLKYKDTDGVEQTLVVADTIELLPKDKYAQIVHFKNFDDLPSLKTGINDAVTMTLTVGYAAGTVPKGLIQGIKLLLTDNYDFRGDKETKYNTTSRKKLEPYKYYI